MSNDLAENDSKESRLNLFQEVAIDNIDSPDLKEEKEQIQEF